MIVGITPSEASGFRDLPLEDQVETARRAFEAAARHNGFVGASEELNVTRGAISRHVKLLEDHLGTPLFRRHAKGVDLTDAGQRTGVHPAQVVCDLGQANRQYPQLSGGLNRSVLAAQPLELRLRRGKWHTGMFRQQYGDFFAKT